MLRPAPETWDGKRNLMKSCRKFCKIECKRERAGKLELQERRLRRRRPTTR